MILEPEKPHHHSTSENCGVVERLNIGFNRKLCEMIWEWYDLMDQHGIFSWHHGHIAHNCVDINVFSQLVSGDPIWSIVTALATGMLPPYELRLNEWIALSFLCDPPQDRIWLAYVYNHHNFSNSQIISCNNPLVIDQQTIINSQSNLGMFITFTSLEVHHCMLQYLIWELAYSNLRRYRRVVSQARTCALDLLQVWCLDSTSVCNAWC